MAVEIFLQLVVLDGNDRISFGGDLVDRIPFLPNELVHLIGGASGAGKTRWLLSTLKEMENGGSMFGYSIEPFTWAYAAADRPLSEVRVTLESIGLDPYRMNLIPAFGANSKILADIYNEAIDLEVNFLVIEAFASFAQGETMANSRVVKYFLESVQRYIEARELTIIGVVESPKMKPKDKYKNPRQRISGAAGWAHYSSTIMMVELEDESDPNNRNRLLYIYPRNLPPMIRHGSFDSGGRIVFNDPLENTDIPYFR